MPTRVLKASRLVQNAWIIIAVGFGLVVVAAIAVAFVMLLMAWLAIPPSLSRDWQPDVAMLPWAEVRGEHLIVHNVRNAEYSGTNAVRYNAPREKTRR